MRRIRRDACRIVLALALALAAAERPAWADPDEASTEADPSSERRPRLLHFGWERGPTYEIGWFAPVADPATGVPAGFGFRGRVGGQLSIDGGHLGGSVLEDGWTAELRRGRVSTSGEFTLWRDTDYMFEFGFERNEFFLNDFYLRRRVHRLADSVRFGYFDPPVSMNALESSTARPLMEQPAPVAAFAPGYRVGLEADGTRESPDLTWALNLNSIGQTQSDKSATSSAIGVAGRLVWRPWFDPTGEAPTLLHLGGSLSVGVGGLRDLQLRARPESYLAPFVLDTEDFGADTTNVALELAWQRGPLSLEAEFFDTLAGVDAGGTLSFEGAYVELVRTLTGEARPYDRSKAVFGRLEPRRPFAPRRGQWGALELAGRLSWVNLSDGPIHGGRMVSANVGVTWTWNDWVRLLAGYVYARVSDRPASGGAHVLQARFELRF